ncbi:MAG: hypothetical protein WC054_09555 [Candidatus Nanopelagicales bacterium]
MSEIVMRYSKKYRLEHLRRYDRVAGGNSHNCMRRGLSKLHVDTLGSQVGKREFVERAEQELGLGTLG